MGWFNREKKENEIGGIKDNKVWIGPADGAGEFQEIDLTPKEKNNNLYVDEIRKRIQSMKGKGEVFWLKEYADGTFRIMNSDGTDLTKEQSEKFFKKEE